jgi:glutathione synthase/RimK-type ligase-like ATP-grasp enzyme
LIWWRRTTVDQKLPPEIDNPFQLDLIRNDCQAAILGLLRTSSAAVWINEPEATRLAENKLVQLAAAERAGLSVPRSLLSQDPGQIRAFCRALPGAGAAVVKPVRGTSLYHLFTHVVTADHLASDEALSLAPALYQELIPGESHVRAHCFGEAVVSVLIESEALDWRQNLAEPSFAPYRLPATTERQLLAVVRGLGLRMGVVDLKLNARREPVWLEVNPQGQFLFAEALSGVELTAAFASFLEQEADRVAARRRSGRDDPARTFGPAKQ